MRLNWAERWVVNNPLRVFEQRLEIRWMRRALDCDPGGRILEIGCGRGAGAALIRAAFSPAALLASDVDPGMLARAERYLRRRGRARIHLLAADAAALPLGDRSIDAVFDFGALHHVPDWRRALAELSRVLRSGGRFFFEELYPALYQNALTRRLLAHPAENRFRSGELRAALAEAGLRLRAAREVPGIGVLGAAVREP